MKKISIHALREEGDVLFDFLQMMPIPISIPALREEGDGSVHLRGLRHRYFYPRPPRGGRPSPLHLHFIFLLFLSTPSARRATPEGTS